MSQWIISQRKCFIFDQLITFLQKHINNNMLLVPAWWLSGLGHWSLVSSNRAPLMWIPTDVYTHWCGYPLMPTSIIKVTRHSPKTGAHWLAPYNWQGFSVLISSGDFVIPELLLIVTADGNKIKGLPIFQTGCYTPVRNLYSMRTKNEIISFF